MVASRIHDREAWEPDYGWEPDGGWEPAGADARDQSWFLGRPAARRLARVTQAPIVPISGAHVLGGRRVASDGRLIDGRYGWQTPQFTEVSRFKSKLWSETALSECSAGPGPRFLARQMAKLRERDPQAWSEYVKEGQSWEESAPERFDT